MVAYHSILQKGTFLKYYQNNFYCMELEIKQKILDAIAKLQPECIVTEKVYKCGNDGMVCFNGMIAELVNGDKYDKDDKWLEVENEISDQIRQDQEDE